MHALKVASVYGLGIIFSTEILWAFTVRTFARWLLGWMLDGLFVWPLIKIGCKTASFNTL